MTLGFRRADERKAVRVYDKPLDEVLCRGGNCCRQNVWWIKLTMFLLDKERSYPVDDEI
jgi:hypothetical protein